MKRNDHILGKHSNRPRQIDISIRHTLGLSDILIVVECKRHDGNIGMDLVEGFATKLKDVGANVGIMVAEHGFVEGARNIAAEHGIRLYTLKDTRKPDWLNKIEVKFFVDAAVIHLENFVPTDKDRKPLESDGEPFRLFENSNPKKEVSANEFIRDVWKRHGETEDVVEVCYIGKTVNDMTGEISENLLFIKFKATVKRFTRDASLQLLGLVGTDGVAYTNSFQMVTEPDKSAVFYTGRDWWQTLDIPGVNFAIVVKSCAVVWPDKKNDPKTLAHVALNSNLHRLPIWVASESKQKPMTFNLSQMKPPRDKLPHTS